MVSKEFLIEHIDQNEQIVEEIISLLKKFKIFTFQAEMGAGKTTLIHSILKCLKVQHFDGSPTYSIINEYVSPEWGKIYHLDLFRLNSIKEAYDIGIEEIFSEKNIIFIEWPEILSSFLKDENVVHVFINVIESKSRKFEIVF